MAVKEFWKSVHICQSYDNKSSVLFFWDKVYIYTVLGSYNGGQHWWAFASPYCAVLLLIGLANKHSSITSIRKGRCRRVSYRVDLSWAVALTADFRHCPRASRHSSRQQSSCILRYCRLPSRTRWVHVYLLRCHRPGLSACEKKCKTKEQTAQTQTQ